MTYRTQTRIVNAAIWAVIITIPVALAMVSPEAAAMGTDMIITGGVRG